MATDREIKLDQALVAVLGAAKELGYDIDEIAQRAKAQVLGNTKYRKVEHPHVSNACDAIDAALGEVKAIG